MSTTRRPTNGKVSATVRRLLALEKGQHQLTTEVAGINGRLDILTTHVIAQGETLKEAVAVLIEHTAILSEHTAILKNQTQVLTEHTRILTEHTGILAEHGQRMGRIETLLTDVLALGPRIDALDHRVTVLEVRP